MNTVVLQLMLTKGIGNVALNKIFDYIHVHKDCSLDMIPTNTQLLRKILNCNEEVLISFNNSHTKALMLANQLNENRIKVIKKYDDDFPKRLINVLKKDCPAVIFVKGNAKLLKSKSVGFCGARDISEKGVNIAKECVKELVKNEITITSGYAKGTDMAAHSTALENKGKTIFVLAEGILNLNYKQPIKKYINDNSDDFVFISQFIPNSIWSAANAMKRNALILGLSKAMVLIESKTQGGTYSAGLESLNRGIPLFVVDYANPDESAKANSFFISKGGYPIRGKNGIPNTSKILYVVNQNDSFNESTMIPEFDPEQLTFE